MCTQRPVPAVPIGYDVAYGTDDDGLTLNLEPTEEAP
jgi:hypothetical protein